jgi:hypothetical protein
MPWFRCLQRSSRASTRRNRFSSGALSVYLFAGLVPGIFACGGFTLLGANYGPARSSVVMYMAPITSVLLSFLREAPDVPQIAGGGLILAGRWPGPEEVNRSASQCHGANSANNFSNRRSLRSGSQCGSDFNWP